jgi:hypothetical protein
VWAAGGVHRWIVATDHTAHNVIEYTTLGTGKSAFDNHGAAHWTYTLTDQTTLKEFQVTF